jgi:hypothetical protein
MSGDRPSEGESKFKLPPWLVPKNLAEVLAVAGAATYAVTYVACVIFYAPLGVEPSDVGLGYAEVLAQAAVYLGVLVGVGLVSWYVGTVATRAMDAIDWWWASRAAAPRARPRSGPRMSRSANALGRPHILPPARMSSKFAVLLLFVLAVSVLATAAVDRGKVKSGQSPVFGGALFPWGDTEVAHLRWVDASAFATRLPRCVIRLGEAAGTEVLYDPRSSATLRLPQSALAVEIRPDAEGCGQPEP